MLPVIGINVSESPAIGEKFSRLRDELWWRAREWFEAMNCALPDDETLMGELATGQAPLVFNEVKPTIDWIIGTERRTRVDYKILPREKDDDDVAGISDTRSMTTLHPYQGV